MGMQPNTATADTVQLPDFDDVRTAKGYAQRVETYWAELGHRNVRCWVEAISVGAHGRSAYEIRSNLVRGLPPVDRA